MRRAFLSFAVALISIEMIKAETVFESPEEQVSLVELYTSEGCSSCPPAEAWLGKLKTEPGLWKDFVPVAFHVDYWNDLGWPDRFSSEIFTERQRRYSTEWRASTIYTPGFVLNGREWRRQGALNADQAKKAGILRASVADGKVHLTFRPAAEKTGKLVFSVAPLGQASTNVRRGENAGRTLEHDFVALGLLQAEALQAPSGVYSAQVTLPETTTVPVSGLAIWIASESNLAPLQAAGGWLQESDKGL